MRKQSKPTLDQVTGVIRDLFVAWAEQENAQLVERIRELEMELATLRPPLPPVTWGYSQVASLLGVYRGDLPKFYLMGLPFLRSPGSRKKRFDPEAVLAWAQDNRRWFPNLQRAA